MAEPKYAIAWCAKSRQLYHLALAADGRTVTSFTQTAGSCSTTRPSRLPDLVTDATLRPCPRCGGRQVSGCSCLHTLVACEIGIGYRFQCIYCDQLRIVKYSG